MNYIFRNLRIPVQDPLDLKQAVSRKLRIPEGDFSISQIVRRGLDTRRRNQPIYDYTLELSFSSNVPKNKDLLAIVPEPAQDQSSIHTAKDPVVVGMGPAGLFAALALVEQGFKPLIIERGKALAERAVDVAAFWDKGILDEGSNVQYGEGGAGAFSDGKLTSRGQSSLVRRVYELLISFGANPDIAFEALPHCGTEGIRAITKAIRDHLLERGATIRYNAKLEDLKLTQGSIDSIKINGEWQACDCLILALGNSARDSFRMLDMSGIAMEAKPFAVGFRIEQLQARINRSIYGSERWAELLGAAGYRLTAGKGYTFCMCPGGEVIAASTQSGGIVTNGMSFAARSGEYCNSAIVVAVDSSVYGDGLFAGMDFQTQIEQKIFSEGYLAPQQAAEDFLKGTMSSNKLPSTYRPDTYNHDLSSIFPELITNEIKSSLHKFDTIISEFSNDAILIAAETRTSSPVRILRDKDSFHSLSAKGVFPVGEGSGYSGGIISSAADAYKVASRIRLR